jgi:hypothetical protein
MKRTSEASQPQSECHTDGHAYASLRLQTAHSREAGERGSRDLSGGREAGGGVAMRAGLTQQPQLFLCMVVPMVTMGQSMAMLHNASLACTTTPTASAGHMVHN